jgi:hypothetical protein
VLTLGRADDVAQADGVRVLSHEHADAKARAMVGSPQKGNRKPERLTVRQAMERYIESKRQKGECKDMAAPARPKVISVELEQVDSGICYKERCDSRRSTLAQQCLPTCCAPLECIVTFKLCWRNAPVQVISNKRPTTTVCFVPKR